MKLSDLKSAAQLAKKYGVKSIIFGAPGSGKTPIITTAPRPLLLASEPGLLSIRTVTNIPVWEGYTVAKITEFFKWFFESNEVKNFDTLAIDSLSNLAETILIDEIAKQKHGMRAYGNMAERVNLLCNQLYHLQDKHVVMLCKQGFRENGRQTLIAGGEVTTEAIKQKIPYFPGQDLNIKIPHLFDNVLHLDRVRVPGEVNPVSALRTLETTEIFSRSRSGNLAELEPPNLTAIFQKSLS